MSALYGQSGVRCDWTADTAEDKTAGEVGRDGVAPPHRPPLPPPPPSGLDSRLLAILPPRPVPRPAALWQPGGWSRPCLGRRGFLITKFGEAAAQPAGALLGGGERERQKEGREQEERAVRAVPRVVGPSVQQPLLAASGHGGGPALPVGRLLGHQSGGGRGGGETAGYGGQRDAPGGAALPVLAGG